MEERFDVNEIVLLMDNYSESSKKLFESLKLSGINCHAYVMDENGFLADGVDSVYGFFLGDFSKSPNGIGRPRYFNEIEVPDYWEISGTASEGKVNDLYRVRGKIFYAEPKNKRLVRVVDWYDERGVARSCDHYNRFGVLFARTILNAKGEKVNKSYFSATGQVVIEENYVRNCLIVNIEGKTYMFSNKMDFLMFFAEKAGLKGKRVFYNTLSTPFFISQRLAPERNEDILFWQEPERPDIPGNMTVILNGNSARTKKIYVQNRAAYDKMISLGVSKDIVKRLGFVYPFERDTNYNKEVLISTNSDQVEKLEEIVTALPELQFHITAITEMSSKLMNMEKHENVKVYPNVKGKVQENLLSKCDIYLDINHGNEILDAVYRAFLNNQVIYAFNETKHNAGYIQKENIFASDDYEKMIKDIKRVLNDKNEWKRKIKEQKDYALATDAEAYRSAVL